MNIRLAAIAAALALTLPNAAGATVVIGQSFEEMARDTPLILRGVALSSEARWDDGRRTINTWTRVRVTAVLKGAAGAEITLRQPGGEVDGLGQHVSGAARFEPGEEVLLFLEPPADAPSQLIVRGLSAGKVRLAADALGRPRATRDLRGIALWSPGASPEVREIGREEDLGDVEAFVRRIKTAVKRAAAAGAR